jgi:CheY-like chemotaxis protein
MSTLTRKHILLIDDDEDELTIFDAAMKELNIPFKCTYAKSAEHALQMLHFLVPDYIFLDYNMPKIDGLDCLKEIRQINTLRNVPVVMYSTCITREVNNKAHELGVNICFNKPSKLNTFTAILKEIIQETEEVKVVRSR